jgi:4-amino-4-deoxy-L-arabinose transferase-like glycosyltransferase
VVALPFSRLRLGPGIFAAVLGVIVLLFAIRNLPWHLDDYDQAKQAYVSFEMVKEGHWWLQHTPAGRIATKPPLVGWVSAGFWAAMGGHAWSLAWRLPGIIAAAWLVWLLARKGRAISGWEGATLAVAAFGLNLVAPRLTTLVRTDMALTLFIALAGFLIYEKLRVGTAWTAADRWKMFAILLASMLTKGPIVYAFLLPGLVAFWWLQRKRLQPVPAWSGWWSWFGPLVFFAAWAGVGLATDQEFYDQVVRREFLGRFTVGEQAVHHNQPVFFYLFHILRDFFPWSVVLIAAACVRDVREKLRRDPALLWLVCWAIGGLVFMSLVPSKRGDRIFPVYPPLCLLVPAVLAMLPERWRITREQRALVLIVVALVPAGSYATYRWVESIRFHDEALTAFSAQVRALARPDRVAVISGKDEGEGMLLYLDQVHFTTWDDARDRWKSGAIDVLVAPLEDAKSVARELPDSNVAFTSVRRKKPFQYICLTRRPE